MRPQSGTLATFLQSRLPTWKSDLFAITLRDGTVYNWTDFDQSLTLDGTTYTTTVPGSSPTIGPLLSRTRLSVRNTIEVPELELKLAALDAVEVWGANIKQQLHNRAFDGASLLMTRIFMPSPGDTSLGGVPMFGGSMASSSVDATGGSLTFKGSNVRFNQYLPRNTFETSCLHSFCDAGCTLLESSFTLTAQVVGSGATSQIIPWTSPPADATKYTLGKLTMTSGAAINQVRTVKVISGSTITLTYPLYNAPASGDTFSILRGCDKTLNTSSGQDCTHYANTQHYRGFPFIPPAYVAF